MVVVIAVVAGFLLNAITPYAGYALYLDPNLVAQFQLWRVLTWVMAGPIGLWPVVTLFFFWWFGTQLERQIGRSRFAWYVTGCTLALAALVMVLSWFTPLYGVLGGLDMLELMVLLTFIAEYPRIRFFFGIPGWAIGAILIAVQILSMLTSRYWFGLLVFVLGMGLCALVARATGLLADYSWLPALGRGRPRTPRRKSRNRRGSTVVTGPWEHQSPDQAALDALLDKIHESGIDSLTKAEHSRLLELRKRLRGG